MRTRLALVAVALAALGTASSVSAASPTTVQIDVSFPVDLCPGVAMEQTLAGTVKIITQNPQQEIQVFPNTTVSFTANGKTLSTIAPGILHITYNPDGSIAQTIVTGLSGALTVPGHGVILLDTGYIVFAGEFAASPVVSSPGPHEFFGADADLEAFCAYFEGTL
jgi:hypothetical protein